MLSTGVTGGAGKARHELVGREFRVLQLAAVTVRSVDNNRMRLKLSTIVFRARMFRTCAIEIITALR